MSELNIVCPGCQEPLVIDASDVGAALGCPHCGSSLEIDWSQVETTAAPPSATSSRIPKAGGKRKLSMTGRRNSAAAPPPSPRRSPPPTVEENYGGRQDRDLGAATDSPRPKSTAGMMIGAFYCFAGFSGCLQSLAMVAVMGGSVASAPSGNGAEAPLALGVVILLSGMVGLFHASVLWVGIALIRMRNWARVTAVVVSVIQGVVILGLAAIMAIAGLVGAAGNKSGGGALFFVFMALIMAIFAVIPYLQFRFLTTTRAKVAYGILPVSALDN